ncbi:PilZ domain-containing protein [Desulfogranum japonicum]|uniref:PilZ domain-containing protein n=1 Tax=Desulfogranum japonicum TaxID=231447 RepID=UPI00042856BF|nr:PilZ domain-containing protein [Desulfogranum japonicum]
MAAITKSYINQTGCIPLECPHCRRVKQISADKLPANKRKFKVKCTCGETFTTEIEHRKNYRKQTNFIGELMHAIPQNGKVITTCRINNLSQNGVGIEVFTGPQLREEETILVRFHLDNKKHTLVEKKAKVTHVGKRNIGAEFVDHFTGGQDKEIYFFLKQ